MKKLIRMSLTAAVTVLSFLFSSVAGAAANDLKQNRLLERLGYTEEVVSGVLTENVYIGDIAKSLPIPADRKYISSYTENKNVINIAYEFDYSNSYVGGNGLDPYSETVRENNALLLFLTEENLLKVNFLHYDEDWRLDHTDTYTSADITARFGEVNPQQLEFADLYKLLAENIQLSEYYFAHYSRIYLGAGYEEVEYRNGEPNRIEILDDGSRIWTYLRLMEALTILPSGDSEVYIPGHTEKYRFDENNKLCETLIYQSDGESYEKLTEYLGEPQEKYVTDSGYEYIAYMLREGGGRYAYFLIDNGAVIAQGLRTVD